MFRFLTDELQSAEDAGDAGKRVVSSQSNETGDLKPYSLDSRTCPHRLGWKQSPAKPDEPLSVVLAIQDVSFTSLTNMHPSLSDVRYSK